jgi:hypothetical protein
VRQEAQVVHEGFSGALTPHFVALRLSSFHQVTQPSTMTISDTGLGHETGEGTDFITVTQR